MKLFSLTVGIEKRGDGGIVQDVETRLDVIRQHLVAIAGGYTETATRGGWKNSKGEIVSEAGRRFDVVAEDVKLLVSFAKAVVALLHQESVLVTVSDVTAIFIGA